MPIVEAPHEPTETMTPVPGPWLHPSPAWSDHPALMLDEELDEDEAYFLGDEDDDDDDDDDMDFDDDEFDEFDDDLEEELDAEDDEDDESL